MEPKRIKLDDIINKLKECCICGVRGTHGMANVFNLSLRENEGIVSSFTDILEFALGLKIHVGASDICAKCKQLTIEFYHFKRRSHLNKNPLAIINSQIPANVSSLAQDSMRIIDMYIKKFSIKALRIEESDEKLIIMRKPPNIKLLETPSECQQDQTIPPIAIKEPVNGNPVITSIKEEPSPEVPCVKIKMEPDLIIEDIGEDSMDSNSSRPITPKQNTQQAIPEKETSQNLTPKEETSNDYKLLLNINQQIFQIVQEINSKVDNFGPATGGVEKMYDSDEDLETDGGNQLEIPANLKCETLPEILHFNKVLEYRENQEKLEQILKERLAGFSDNYKLLLKEGLNLLMAKPIQCLICKDGQSVLKKFRAVKCLIKVTHEIFGTPIEHIERYLYQQLFMKKSITAFS